MSDADAASHVRPGGEAPLREGRERAGPRSARLLEELPDYRSGPYADIRKWLTPRSRRRASARTPSTATRSPFAARAPPRSPSSGRRTSGKSSLLQALSEIQIKTGDYPFTTLRPVPALTRIGGVLVQLVEIPGLIEGATEDRGGGRALLGVLRTPTRSSTATRRPPPAELEVVRRRSRRPESSKPAFLAATEGATRRMPRRRRLAGGLRGPRGRPRVGPRRREPRALPRGGLAPDRADPRAASAEAAGTDPEPIALDARRDGRRRRRRDPPRARQRAFARRASGAVGAFAGSGSGRAARASPISTRSGILHVTRGSGVEREQVVDGLAAADQTRLAVARRARRPGAATPL